MAEYVVITGLSGAGRTQAANVLEDLDWFVIDNLPLALVSKIAELVEAPGSPIDRVALVVGRNAPEALGSEQGIGAAIDHLRASGADVKLVFLDADDDALIRRYEGSRRPHPLAEHEGVAIGIVRERIILERAKERADVVIDTTDISVHELRARLVELFSPQERAAPMSVSVVSFGYKHGLPTDVDLVFDLRFLPNPHWVEELRPFTGLDPQVREFVLSNSDAQRFLVKLDDLFGMLLPAYLHEGKSYLSIAVGCTGGQHRSVAMAEELAKLLAVQGFPAAVRHRDLHKR